MKIEKVKCEPDEVWEREILFEKGDVIHSKNHGFWIWVKIKNDLVFRIFENRLSFYQRLNEYELVRPGVHLYKVKQNEDC